MSKEIELAKKLKELADKGVDGEKTNAEEMLKAFMKKHKITFEDIEGEKIEMHFFNFDKAYLHLFTQIVKSINVSLKIYGEIPKNKMKDYGATGNYAVESTVAEYIEISSKFDFYLRLYLKELDVFNYAFYRANKLLIKPKEDAPPPSEEDIALHMRAVHLSLGIKSETYHKQIDNG